MKKVVGIIIASIVVLFIALVIYITYPRTVTPTTLLVTKELLD